MVVIKRAKDVDVEPMVDFGKGFWEQTSFFKQHGIPYDLDQCARLTRMLIDKGIVQVAKDSDRVVGVILLMIGPVPFNSEIKQATEMVFYVDPAYRKQGVGEKLLRQAENVAKQQGVTLFNMVHLDSVAPEKPGALYEKHGYKPSETVFTKEL